MCDTLKKTLHNSSTYIILIMIIKGFIFTGRIYIKRINYHTHLIIILILYYRRHTLLCAISYRVFYSGCSNIFNMYKIRTSNKSARCVTSSIEDNLRKLNFSNNLPAGSEDVDKMIRYSAVPSLLFATNMYSFSVSDF